MCLGEVCHLILVLYSSSRIQAPLYEFQTPLPFNRVNNFSWTYEIFYSIVLYLLLQTQVSFFFCHLPYKWFHTYSLWAGVTLARVVWILRWKVRLYWSTSFGNIHIFQGIGGCEISVQFGFQCMNKSFRHTGFGISMCRKVMNSMWLYKLL